MLLLALVFGVVFAHPAVAAQQSVVLSGRVTDPSGGAVSDAAVEATSGDGTTIETSTGLDGSYRLTLPFGIRSDVRVRQQGFAEERLALTPGGDAVHDFVLRIGPVLDTLVVTAARLPQSLSTSAASVTVITSDEIEAMGVAQLADVLRQVPGVSIESNGREGAVASMFARGGESDYNHVLIDGVRVNANGGQFDFSRVATAGIDRVEVVRGAQSALYGSDAIGAVVHVFTKGAAPGDAPQVSGTIEGGSFLTGRGEVRLSGGARSRLDYSAGVFHRTTRGAFSDVLLEDDRFDQTTVQGGVGVLAGRRAALRMGVRYSEGRGRAPGPVAYGSRDSGTRADSREMLWHGTVTHAVTSRLDHTATLAYFESRRLSADQVPDPPFNVFAVMSGRPGALFPDSPRLVRLVDEPTFSALRAGTQPLEPGQFLATTPSGVGDFPFTSETRLTRPTFRSTAHLNLGPGQVFVGGYEFERERDSLNAGFRAHSHAYFGQQQFTWRDRWFATVGGRLDRHSRYGTELSPKASFGGFVLPFNTAALSSVRLFGNIGRGIKTPLFGELFGSPFSDGNPDLHPERARTFDAGAEATFFDQRWRARATYFHNSFRDQVAFRSSGPGRDGRPDFINIDGSRASGWELEAALQQPIGGLTAGGSYSLVDTEVVAFVSTSEQFQPGQPLLRRPKHSALLRGRYVAGAAALHVHLQLVGRRHDAAFLGLSAVPSPGSPIAVARPVDITVNPGYATVGIGCEYRIRSGVAAFFRADNVADADYQGALGYPGVPRSFFGGFRLAMPAR